MRAFDVVDAAGERRTVTATSDPELFWALRGGGGDLAVVTSMETGLVEVPALSGGRIVWPASHAGRVLAHVGLAFLIGFAGLFILSETGVL